MCARVVLTLMQVAGIAHFPGLLLNKFTPCTLWVLW